MKKFSLSILSILAFYLISCSSSSTKGTISLGDLVTVNGGTQSGSVVNYKWKDLVPGYTESDSHLYGFDRDPLSDSLPEYGEFVYLSVADSELAYLRIHLSSSAYDSYVLQDSSGIPTSVVDSQNVALNAGNYTLYGVNGDSTVDLQRYVQVISYPVKTVPGKYVQIDGLGWDTANDTASFTFEKTKNKFDAIFAQGVLKSDFEDVSPANYRLPDTLVIDMTDIDTTLLSNAYEKAKDLFTSTKDFADTRVIIAVNQMRKKWPLSSLYEHGNDSAINFTNFNPLSENSGIVYKMESIGGEDCGGVGSTINVEIRGTLKNNTIVAPYYAFYNGSLVRFGSCDVLYTDNGYPIVPSADESNAAVTWGGPYTYSFGDGIDHYAVFSVVWAPRSAGTVSHNTLMHEIGHSLGLVDVHKDTTILVKDTISTSSTYYLADGTVYTGTYSQIMEVATTESDNARVFL